MKINRNVSGPIALYVVVHICRYDLLVDIIDFAFLPLIIAVILPVYLFLVQCNYNVKSKPADVCFICFCAFKSTTYALCDMEAQVLSNVGFWPFYSVILYNTSA